MNKKCSRSTEIAVQLETKSLFNFNRYQRSSSREIRTTIGGAGDIVGQHRRAPEIASTNYAVRLSIAARADGTATKAWTWQLISGMFSLAVALQTRPPATPNILEHQNHNNDDNE